MGTHVYNKYQADFDFGGRKILNLGCGFAKFSAKNVVNLDAFDICKPDVVADLNKPLPFEDETFDGIIANHVMEHVENFWGCFNEMARVTKTGGMIEIWVPGSGSDSIFGYRDHVREVNHCSFFGVHGTYRAGGNAWAADNAKCHANRLKQIGAQCALDGKVKWLWKIPNFMRQWCATHLRNVVVENGYFFEKITVEEQLREQREFDERVRTNRLIPV
jgi:SAM-dependent methyltransferase